MEPKLWLASACSCLGMLVTAGHVHVRLMTAVGQSIIKQSAACIPVRDTILKHYDEDPNDVLILLSDRQATLSPYLNLLRTVR